MAIAGENTKFTLIRCADDAEWHRVRNEGIGGSDVAAILGLSKWSSPSEVYLDKIGKGLPDDKSKRDLFEFGNIMEPYVRKRFAEIHPEVMTRRVNAICRDIARPWAQASLDYECRENGEWGVLEIKTAPSQSVWAEGIPPYYKTQVMHYLAVTGRKFAWVAVLFRDSAKVMSYRVTREDDYIEGIERAVDDFWNNHVQTHVPPKTCGTENEAKALTAIWGIPIDAIAYATDPETAQVVQAYKDAVQAEKTAKDTKTKLANWLISRIGKNQALVSGTDRVTWRRYERETFDKKSLKKEMPDVYRKYAGTQLTSGGLRITKVKNQITLT